MYYDQFAWARTYFGTRLIRQARQKAVGLAPAAEGQPSDTPLSRAAGEAFGAPIDIYLRKFP